KKYQTRVVSTANKVNLKFEEALPELKKGLSNSISGLL
ncbi:complement resistance protein TraT, partial [Endozoicomonas sp. ALE010]